jgi:ASC-1-like (ASCH) protein
MNRHELRILPQYFDAVNKGNKTFEVRKNDRKFAVGDQLILNEWDPEKGYTGCLVTKRVSYILNDQLYLRDGYVVLGLN